MTGGRIPGTMHAPPDLTALLPHALAMIWCADSAGRLLFASEYFADFTGSQPEQLLAYGWTDHVHLADLPELLGDFRAAVLHGAPFEARYRMRRGDGAYRLVLSRATPLQDETDVTRWFVGSTVDLGGDREREVSSRAGLREATLMCDNCERVRDAEGSWHEPREFVLRHWRVSLARCPICGDA